GQLSLRALVVACERHKPLEVRLTNPSLDVRAQRPVADHHEANVLTVRGNAPDGFDQHVDPLLMREPRDGDDEVPPLGAGTLGPDALAGRNIAVRPRLDPEADHLVLRRRDGSDALQVLGAPPTRCDHSTRDTPRDSRESRNPLGL